MLGNTTRFQSSTSRQVQSPTQTLVAVAWDTEVTTQHTGTQLGHWSSQQQPQLALQTPLSTPSAVEMFTGGSLQIQGVPTPQRATWQHDEPGC